MKNKSIVVIIVSLFLVGGFLVLRSVRTPSADGEETAPAQSKSTSKSGSSSTELVTAKEAWVKVKPEANKWSNNYKIAKISDISNPKYQRIDGQSVGWEFYLEDCQEYYTSKSLGDSCIAGKSKSFYYQVVDFVGRSKGVTADSENKMPSGRTAFSPDIFKINSDEAQDLARQAEGRERNDYEEFVMMTGHSNDIFYWEVRRQCWSITDRTKCDSQNYYSAYVNIETGEAYSEKP